MSRKSRRRVSKGRIAAVSLALVALVAVGGVLAYSAVDRPQPVTAERVPLPDLRPPNSAPLPVAPGSTALFYGDSLTAGSFTPQDATTFRGLVTSEAAIATAINVSVRGIRTGTFVEENPVAPGGVGLALIELGTNDVGNTDVEDFRGSYSRLLTTVRDANPDAALLCLGPWRPTQVAAPYSSAIREECVSRGGRYIPLDVQYGQARNRGPEGVLMQGEVTDNFHPNEAGHAVIAQQIMDRLDVPDRS